MAPDASNTEQTELTAPAAGTGFGPRALPPSDQTSEPPRADGARQTLQLLRPHRSTLATAVGLGVLGTAASLAQPYLTGTVVGRIIGHHPVVWPFLLLAALFATEGGLGAAQVYLLGRTGNAVVLGVRRSLTTRLLRAPLAAHFAHRRGDLISTVVADTSIMGSLLAQSLATLVSSAVMVVGSISFMAYLDLVLTGVILACVAVAGALSFVIARRLREATRLNRDRVGEFGSALLRAVGDIRTVKVSRAEGREEQRIGAYADRSFDASMRATRLNALMTPAMGLGVQASFMAVFTVGAYRLSDGGLTTATFSSYLLYLLYLIAPLLNFFTGLAQFQQSAASSARVGSIVGSVGAEDADAEAEAVGRTGEASTHPAPGSVELRSTMPLLEFSGVTFGFLPDTTVLDDVSFTLPDRGLTVMVGPSGAGKSTAFGLIERFWTAERGTIMLRGTDIATIPLDELRGAVGYVEQNAAVLDGTLRENLLYANPTATERELTEAIDLTCLRGWVDSLPMGLDTPVGESGTAISGGERQRIAIARMLLVNPALLLLDEATSQLDAGAAAVLNETITRVARRCAVLAIAHQLDTAACADRILVLDGGAIRARGTHEELSRTDELYRRLWLTQYGQRETASTHALPLASAPIPTEDGAPNHDRNPAGSVTA